MFATSINDGPEKSIARADRTLTNQDALSCVSIRKHIATDRSKKNFLKPTEWPSWIAVAIIDLYRLTFGVSFGGQCRFYPSCSTYARQALKKYGLLRGGAATLWRLARCNPFTRGGVDEP